MKLTFADAAKRVTATAVQAAAACSIVLLGMWGAGDANAQTVTATIIGSFAVPVLTAVHRYAQAWFSHEVDGAEDE